MLTEKVIVITGGMGQVGLATTQILVSLGANVICLTRKNIEDANQQLKNISNKCEALLCDITNTESIKNAVNYIGNSYTKVDVLINAAGITRDMKQGEIGSIDDFILESIIQTNLLGPFKVIREFRPLLEHSTEALIINISSTSSLRASRSNPIYAASKAALNSLTQNLAFHLAPKIRVIGIAPGYLELAVSGANKPKEFNDKIANTLPLRRIGSALDVGLTIESVITKIKWTTGHTIILDGGMTI